MAPQPGRRVLSAVAPVERGLRPAASPNDAVPVERRVGRVEFLWREVLLGDRRTSTPTRVRRGGLPREVAEQLARCGLLGVVGRFGGDVAHLGHMSHFSHRVTVGWSAMLPARQISKMWWLGPPA